MCEFSPTERANLQSARVSAQPRVSSARRKTLVCYHGSPRSYKERILPTTPEEELEQALAGTQGDLLVGGHTHAQMFRRFKDQLVFNPGSVGLAMDRVSPLSEIRQPAFAEYAIVEYDKTTLQVELHRIAFDLQAFIQVMHTSGMPHAAWWASHWKEAEKWPFLRAMLGFPRLSKKRARQRATSLGMGCGTHHILSVVEYGKQLAAILGADADIVEIAALLHDYASIKDSAMYEDHHLHHPLCAPVSPSFAASLLALIALLAFFRFFWPFGFIAIESRASLRIAVSLAVRLSCPLWPRHCLYRLCEQ